MLSWLKIRKAKLLAAVRSVPAPAVGSSPPLHDDGSLPPHPLLGLLPPGSLDRLLADSAMSEYPKGTVIYREDEPCDAIFLILNGRCEVRRGELVEAVAGPGDMLGDRALLNGESHWHTAVVATHAVLLRIPAGELRGLFAADPAAAGRFSQAVVAWPRAGREAAATASGQVRRVVSILPLSPRVDVKAVVTGLAAALRRISGQRVLVVRLDRAADGVAAGVWPARDTALGAEFAFQRHLRPHDLGFDELPLQIGGETRERAAIAPLISHCAQHYPFVLLHLRPELPVPATIEGIIESDLAFVLLQPSTQNLYDFQLLVREVCDRSRGACTTLNRFCAPRSRSPRPSFTPRSARWDIQRTRWPAASR